MKLPSSLLALMLFIASAANAQLKPPLSQTRISQKIQTWSPDKWAVTDWQKVQSDDNSYIKSKTLNGANLGAIMFFNLGFAVPSGAAIQKIEATIIRLKNGRNTVTEQTVALLKALNSTEACGGSSNKASTAPWTEYENKMLYSFPANGNDCQGLPFQWTAEEVNKPMFGLLLHPFIGAGGKGATVLIEQVALTVYYTVQTSVSAPTQASTKFQQVENALTATLKQNAPNPAIGTTLICYHIPGSAKTAKVDLSNARGQVVKTIPINGKGAGQFKLNTSAYSAGTYYYTLWVDGKTVNTKRLLIAR